MICVLLCSPLFSAFCSNGLCAWGRTERDFYHHEPRAFFAPLLISASAVPPETPHYLCQHLHARKQLPWAASSARLHECHRHPCPPQAFWDRGCRGRGALGFPRVSSAGAMWDHECRTASSGFVFMCYNIICNCVLFSFLLSQSTT
jgi:hypothetical protein